jgi:FixJ family two-component response regulator
MIVEAKNVCVGVVEDDPSMRSALENLLRSAGFQVRLFASAHEFLDAAPPPPSSRCLILDVGLPGLNGLDLQRELRLAKINTPIIFISGHADDLVSARAMGAGAVGFFTKPFCGQDLLDAIHRALALV